MDKLETIRSGLTPNATDEMKNGAIAACRSILTALEPVAPKLPLPIANLVGLLRTVPPDQLLDLAIDRLRASLPVGSAVPAAQPATKFHLVPIPQHLGSKSAR